MNFCSRLSRANCSCTPLYFFFLKKGGTRNHLVLDPDLPSEIQKTIERLKEIGKERNGVRGGQVVLHWTSMDKHDSIVYRL
jgi:hypothetical protein